MIAHATQHLSEADAAPWLSSPPEHWRLERGKWLFRKLDRPAQDNDEVVTCFRDGVVTLRKNRRTRGFTESLEGAGYQGVRRGDLVIHSMDAFAGAVGVSDSDGRATGVYAVCETTAEAEPHYYKHVIREMARSGWILALAKGIRERSTDFRFATLAEQVLPAPPIEEQQAIARFLDHADRRIQRVIRAKQKLIALLNEQRQAMIHRAVTRGLDPNVRLKSSGVDWLGDVPEHWRVEKVKHLARAGYKTFVDGDWIESPYITDEGIRLIQTGNIGLGVFREKGFRYVTQQTFNELNCTEFHPGDMLICRLGQPVGRACLAPDLGVRMITSVDVCILKPREDVLSEFVVFAMSSPVYLDWVNSLVRGSTRDRVSRSMLGGFQLALPPLAEQRDIASLLRAKLDQLNRSIERSNVAIKLLREYRTRVIADVVTGQLDVWEAAGQLPDDVDEPDTLDEARAEEAIDEDAGDMETVEA